MDKLTLSVSEISDMQICQANHVRNACPYCMDEDSAEKSAETPIVSTVHHQLGVEGLWHTPSKKIPEKQQLPAYIQNIARAIMRDGGHTESEAISFAVNAVKRWSRGKLGWGKRKVTPEVKAAAKRALKEWEQLKASHH